MLWASDRNPRQRKRRRACSIRSSVVGFIFAVQRNQEVIYHEVAYFAAEALASGEIKAKMLSSKDAT